MGLSDAQSALGFDLVTGKGPKSSPASLEAVRQLQAVSALVTALSRSEAWWSLVDDVRSGMAEKDRDRAVGRYAYGKRRAIIHAMLSAAARADTRRAANEAMLGLAAVSFIDDEEGGGRAIRDAFPSRCMLAAETIARRGAGQCVCCGIKLSGTARSTIESERPKTDAKGSRVLDSNGQEETISVTRSVVESLCAPCHLAQRDDALKFPKDRVPDSYLRRKDAEQDTFEVLARTRAGRTGAYVEF